MCLLPAGRKVVNEVLSNRKREIHIDRGERGREG
jgi:hypothetical protein